VLGPVGRWALDQLGRTDEASFTLMLAVVAPGATFAEALQFGGILGAFLAGLAVNAAGQRLIDEPMLNTVLVLAIVTSVLGPILTERYVRRLNGSEPAVSRNPSVLGRGSAP
jgi:Kef-type K+ transport system membrane component KefB